ncbi:MAG TPA: DUF348 domain-containing protein [Firmicutes bacterium]|nr:DUF348 domain-containing protein [Bacillota bacterium]
MRTSKDSSCVPTQAERPLISRHAWAQKGIFGQRMVLLILLGLLSVFAVILYALIVKEVTVSIDGQRIRLRTSASTVQAVMADHGFLITEGDRVYPPLDAEVTEGMQIQVERGVNFVLSVDGTEIPLRAAPSPVQEVLAQAGVTLGPLDKTSIPLEERVWEGLRFKVTRVRVAPVFTKTPIKPTTIYINDDKLEIGKRKVLTKGEPGLLEKEYEVTYEDGREVKRVVKGERIVKHAIRERVAVGTKPHTLVTRGRVIKYKEVRTMDASAYTPGPESCGIYADGYTATGKKAGYGIVAVDPRVIPLGTKLYIEGYGFAAAEDVGSAIKGNRIDLCYETVREALLFGRRKVKVYILAE